MDNTQVTPFFKVKNHKSYEELSVAHAILRLNAAKLNNDHQSRLVGIVASIDGEAVSGKISLGTKESNGFVERVSAQVNSEEQLYAKKAAFYGISLNEEDWCEITNLHMIDAVDAWEKKLREALYLGVNWRVGDYNPDGLEKAIRYREEECREDARQMRMEVNTYYYSSRGV